MREYWQDLALRYRCEYCLAGVGVWCRTNSGAVATHLHNVRSDPIRLAQNGAWDEGFEAGKLRAQSSGTLSTVSTWTG